MSHRDSTKKALNRYFEKLAKEQKPKAPRRKNKAPEKVVVGQLCAWMSEQGWSYDIAEASTYDRITRRHSEGRLPAGFSDVVAAAPLVGVAVAAYIEAKAPSRRSTLKPHQRDFLIRKIEAGSFAVVVDSAQLLEKFWLEYKEAVESGRPTKDILLAMLPKQNTKAHDKIDPEMGF